MKKITAILLAVLFVIGLTACSSTKYTDTEETIPVTDENGETVTDESGNIVTEIVTAKSSEAASSEKASNSKSSKSTTKSSKKSSKSGKSGKSSKTTTKKGKSGKTTTSKSGSSTTAKSDGAKTTTAKETTTEETTTEKPKKREVTVNVQLPYYNDQSTKLSVRYKAEGDDEYTILKIADPEDSKKTLEYETVTLDGETVKSYSLGKLKGKVRVTVYMTGLDIMNNSAVIEADEDSVTIKPETGIEQIKGEDD